MKILNIKDEEYPNKLKNIYNPPKKLYVLGNYNILNDFTIGIVGTRRCTDYGMQIAKSFSYYLSKYGVNIISGMAKGIDSSAHIGSITGKGKTIAVLGSGFKHIYPKENIKLFNKIIETGGAVITEYEENEYPMPENFPKRNRIISGLSDGVIVVEAGKRSGSLITADFALEQGRDVFAVPGNINSENSLGTNDLIKQGAKLVNCFEDCVEKDLFLCSKNDIVKEIKNNKRRES